MVIGRNQLKLVKLQILSLILYFPLEGKGHATPANPSQSLQRHGGTMVLPEMEESFWEGSGMTSWPTSPRYEDESDLTRSVVDTYTPTFPEHHTTSVPLPVTVFTIAPTPSMNHINQSSIRDSAINNDTMLSNEVLKTSYIEVSPASAITLTPPITLNISATTHSSDINTYHNLASLELSSHYFNKSSILVMSSSVDPKTEIAKLEKSVATYTETSSKLMTSPDGLSFTSMFISPVTSSLIATSVFPPLYSSSMFSIIHDLPSFADYNSRSSVGTSPPDANQGRFLVVFKSNDCPEFKSSSSDSSFAKWLSSLGVLNASVEISKSKCHTELTINITVAAPSSVIQRFDDGSQSNLTITILNRTFQVVEIQRLNSDLNGSVINSTSAVITVITKNEFNAYIAVGVSFGLVLIVCISVCCIKCCAKRPTKRLDVLRSSHMPLRPEDYTLTPLPRPSSLYIDYYRGSLTGDLYSTTSAGSVASTSPTVEKGVVQPFDTSIVPLEDSSAAVIADTSRRDSVESVPPDVNTFNIHKVTSQGLIYSNATANSREKLHPRYTIPVETNASGVANPTFQRY